MFATRQETMAEYALRIMDQMGDAAPQLVVVDFSPLITEFVKLVEQQFPLENHCLEQTLQSRSQHFINFGDVPETIVLGGDREARLKAIILNGSQRGPAHYISFIRIEDSTFVGNGAPPGWYLYDSALEALHKRMHLVSDYKEYGRAGGSDYADTMLEAYDVQNVLYEVCCTAVVDCGDVVDDA